MKKDKNNRRKAAIGAVVAAGMTTGAIALAGTPSPGPKPQETELTAADAVVIDGERVEMEDALPKVDNRARPMYGVRERPIRLLYGPRPKVYGPRPDIINKPKIVDTLSLDNRLRVVVAGVMNVIPERVTANADFINDLGADALDYMELSFAVRREFNVSIPEEKLVKLRTIEDLKQYLIDAGVK